MSRPVFPSLGGYRVRQLPRDVAAGMLVVAIAVPLSMGMAETAGVPPVVGLYCCVLPLIAYASFGSSPQLIIALDASTAAMVAAAVGPLADGRPAVYVALASWLAVMVGAILLAAGFARAGRIAEFLTRPVLLGYQATLATVVIVAQLPTLLGLDSDGGTPLSQALGVVDRLDEVDPATAALGATAIAITVGVAAWRRTAPGALLALVACTLAVRSGGSALASVAVVGDVPAGLPTPAIPTASVGSAVALVPAALAIAVLAAGDTLVSSRAFAERNGYRVAANRDLAALGAANVASGVSGGIPVSASAARTAVVEMVGSRSRVAGVTAALSMTAILVFLTRPLESIPSAALAAVVVVAVTRLFEPRSIGVLSRREVVVVLATLIVGVAVGLLQGIVVGAIASAVDRAGSRRTRRGAGGGVTVSGRPATDGPSRPWGSRTRALRSGSEAAAIAAVNGSTGEAEHEPSGRALRGRHARRRA